MNDIGQLGVLIVLAIVLITGALRVHRSMSLSDAKKTEPKSLMTPRQVHRLEVELGIIPPDSQYLDEGDGELLGFHQPLPPKNCVKDVPSRITTFSGGKVMKEYSACDCKDCKGKKAATILTVVKSDSDQAWQQVPDAQFTKLRVFDPSAHDVQRFQYAYECSVCHRWWIGGSKAEVYKSSANHTCTAKHI